MVFGVQMTNTTPRGGSDEYALLEEDVLADTTGPAGAKAAAVDALSELFPDRARSELGRAFVAHSGDLEAAASALASGPIPDTDLQMDPQTSTAGDAALAASLAAENDVRLARRLAAREAAREQRRQSTQSTQNGQITRRPRGHSGTFRATSGELARAVGVLRDVVVPAVHARLKGLTFGDVSSEAQGVRYSLRDVCVVALSLPADHVTVRASGGLVEVHLVHMLVSVSAGRFAYESAVLPISDEGALDASVAGLTAVATLRPARTTAGAIALVCGARDVAVHVGGAVRVRARGTAADWVYNAVAALCKPLVVSYVKDTVARTLRAALLDELRDFQYFPDPTPTPTATPTPEAAVDTTTATAQAAAATSSTTGGVNAGAGLEPVADTAAS